MKKIISMLSAVAMAAVVPMPSMTAAAQTGPSGSVTCVAKSPYAIGAGTAWTFEAACQRALYECAVRTPSHSTCYVTNRWYN